MDNSNRLFRKAVIGGFNKDDVIDYIESMKNEFFEYRKQVEATIGELNQKIKELEEAGSVIRDPDAPSAPVHIPDELEPFENDFKNNVSFSVDEINAATDHLKQTADKLCENLTEFMDKINSSYIAVTVQAPVDEAKKADEKPEDSISELTDLLDDTTDVDKPSADEIAAAYQQAIRFEGDSILTDIFKESDDDTPSAENEKPVNDSFSQFLDSILSAAEVPAEPSANEEKKEETSILDDLLSSSTFFD